MKIWEVIKELMNDDLKEFINERGVMLYHNDQWKELRIKREGEMPDFCGLSCLFNDTHIDDDWQVVETPVSFMVAVASGKNIKAITNNKPEWEALRGFQVIDRFLYNMSQELSRNEIRDILTGDNFIIGED